MPMLKTKSLLITCLTYFSVQVIAQPASRAVVDQSINWASYSSNLKLSDKVTGFVDGQFRLASATENFKGFEPMQHQFRTHLDIAVNKKISVAPIGYVRVWNYLYGKQPAAFINQEHRIYQQITYKHSFKKTNIQHRLRTEERFIQDHDAQGENLGYINKQFRIRYRLMATTPLNKEKVEPGAISSVIFYEGFMSRGSRVTFHDVDQNRLFAGFAFQATSKLSFTLGYYYQMLVKSNGAKQENNIGTLLMVTHNFDLSKKAD
jgi:outer membrane receptor protein involved in Fe transport